MAKVDTGLSDMSTTIEDLRPRIRNAIELAIKCKKPWRYTQSVELILTFKGVDVKKQQEFRFRDDVVLPHGLGEEPRICLVAEDDFAKQYSNLVYMTIPRSNIDTIDKKRAKKIAQQCDFILVRANLMGLVGRVLGPALGPRGKAPIAIPINVDVSSYIERYKKTTRLRSKDQPWAGCKIGIETMPIEHLVENAIAVLHHVEDKVKRPLLQVARIFVKTTSSPAIEV